jgi:hypothetical protein
MPVPIFISHRRSDSGGHARLLYERLMQWFDREAVFYDTDTREAGDALPAHLESALRGARVVLVLISPHWLNELNHRVQLPMRDYVNLEVAFALRGQPEQASPEVIPVLLGGAKPISSAEALHASVRADLQRLCQLQAHEFQGWNRDWNRQFVALRARLARVPGVPTPRYRTPDGEPQRYRVIPCRQSPHCRDPSSALERVYERLEAAGRAAIIARAASYGMGGLGTTQLALRYCAEHRDSYAAVWWFRAETVSALQLDAAEACREMGIVVTAGELPMAAFTHWLKRQQPRWLLVFDNVEYDQESQRSTLPEACLQLLRHHVLITSRHAVGGSSEAVELSAWSEAAGADFLSMHLPHATRAELQRLSRALGGLPLALEQAAACLRERVGSVADYCLQIESVDSSALMLVEARASTRYERAVLASLSLSFPQLTPAAQRLLRLCAFFSAEPIPERYFLEGIQHLPAELASAAQSTSNWDQVVGELQRFGIAERQHLPSLDRAHGQPESAVEPVLLLHRLTLEVVRLTLSVAPEDGPRAQRLLRAQCPEDPSNPTYWPRFAALWHHLMQLDRARSRMWLDRRIHSWMLSIVARYLRAQGDLPTARALDEQVLAIRRRVEGEEHPNTLHSMNNLAGTLWAQGYSDEAITLMNQAVTRSVAALGPEHPATALFNKRLQQMRSRHTA